MMITIDLMAAPSSRPDFVWPSNPVGTSQLPISIPQGEDQTLRLQSLLSSAPPRSDSKTSSGPGEVRPAGIASAKLPAHLHKGRRQARSQGSEFPVWPRPQVDFRTMTTTSAGTYVLFHPPLPAPNLSLFWAAVDLSVFIRRGMNSPTSSPTLSGSTSPR